jgi:hypothetical protein
MSRANNHRRPAVEDAPRKLMRDGVTWLQVAAAARILRVTRGRVYHLMWDRRLRYRELEALPDARLTYVREDDVLVYRIRQKELARLRAR